MSTVLLLRSALFYAGYASVTITWACVSLLVAWMLPLRARFAFVAGTWSRAVLAWLRLCCNVRYRVSGVEHIPAEPCVVLVRHESSWEIPVLQVLFAPQATLLKKELMHIPFFGWGLRLARPIPIDRSDPRGALRTLIRVGARRLQENIWVVLFPEGTRMPPGQRGRLHSGGAALAEATGRPVLVVTHNAGRFWPPRRFVKYPGTIDLVISPPIDVTGKTNKEINALAAAAMDAAMAEIDARADVDARLDVKVDDR